MPKPKKIKDEVIEETPREVKKEIIKEEFDPSIPENKQRHLRT